MKRPREDTSYSYFKHQQSSLYDDANDDDDDDDDSSSSFESLPKHHSPQPPQPPPPPPQSKHFCVICEKQFSSGKAYGGHVRIHSSEFSNKGKTKKMKMKKKKKKLKIKKRNGLVKEEKETDLVKVRCCLCGKEFQTMHSLFGHMRRHPDRSWKGTKPPLLEDDGDGDGDGDGDDDDDVMSDVTKDVQEAACCLMMLKYAYVVMKRDDVEMDHHGDGKGLVVDMKVKIELDVNVDKHHHHDDDDDDDDDEGKKSSLGFDLNEPYHHEDDQPYWN